MTSYDTPKTDWTSSDGVSTDDLNKIGTNTVHLKEQVDAAHLELDNHANSMSTTSVGTLHKTASDIRVENLPFLVEVLQADPTAPAIGRMWLNTSV